MWWKRERRYYVSFVTTGIKDGYGSSITTTRGKIKSRKIIDEISVDIAQKVGAKPKDLVIMFFREID